MNIAMRIMNLLLINMSLSSFFKTTLNPILSPLIIVVKEQVFERRLNYLEFL